MKILSIETSCDETAISIVDVSGGKKPAFKVLGNKVASQIALHAQYGGVFPMMAKREHAKNFTPLLLEVLKESKLLKNRITKKSIDEKKISKAEELLVREEGLSDAIKDMYEKYSNPKIDCIAVTSGPGLEPTLWVGISAAKALAELWNLPIVPVNHMEGHILSVFPKEKSKTFKIENIKLPALSLLVSGGHTELVLVKDIGKYKILGATRDDAAGEAFDKVARMLDLPYPGGPEISKMAHSARGRNTNSIVFPRPMKGTPDFNFSFSGLKTAVLYKIRDIGKLDQLTKEEIALAFEDAVIDVLTHKTIKAIQKYKIKTLIVGGGVAANMRLREILKEKVGEVDKKIDVHFPTRELSTDNSLMIAIAGYLTFNKKKKGVNPKSIKANGILKL